MKQNKERSAYIPVPRGMMEALLCRLMVDFPWLLEAEAPTDPDDCDEFIDAIQGELAILSQKQEAHAIRLMTLFRDRAEFGPPPCNRWKCGRNRKKPASEERQCDTKTEIGGNRERKNLG